MTVKQESDLRAARRREWRDHWTLVLCSTIGFAFYSVIPYSIGLFLEPLSREFGWNRTQIMSGLTLLALAGIFLSPLVGALVDRFGSRRIALPGLVLTALSLSAFGLASGSVVQWTLLFAVQALCVLLIKTTVWTTAVSGTFDAARSLAIAVTVSGIALAQAVVPPLTRWLIAEFGWREAYFILGLGWGALAFVLAYLFLYDAHDRRRAAREEGVQPAAELPGLTLKQALRSPPLIRIGIATFLVMLMGVGIGVHQVPIMVEAGVARDQAAYLASLFGIAGVAGKLVTGWLMDRFEPGMVGGLTLAVSAFAFLLLLEALASVPLIIIGLVVIGYASGTKLQICAYLTSRYGGLKHYGKIFGVMCSLVALGGGIGPVAAGFAFDTFGSYTVYILAAMVLTLFAATMLFNLGPRPREVALGQLA